MEAVAAQAQDQKMDYADLAFAVPSLGLKKSKICCVGLGLFTYTLTF
jgi:hypothetical protein